MPGWGITLRLATIGTCNTSFLLATEKTSTQIIYTIRSAELGRVGCFTKQAVVSNLAVQLNNSEDLKLPVLIKTEDPNIKLLSIDL